ncbi:hypothetical protein CGC20_5255 [Leishmania donovani]|uniref:WD domain, G-beta repeat family protein n=1 Tax=Leishmania donovani TaxID=5661 RepID=A0A504XU63_LEIDO|nr:hypothetical protein CGC20_5255 [Leishmania donovani]
MEFSSSSSSDAGLEEELHRNFHRERREQRGIVRASSAATRCETMRFTMPDGRSIEVRKGSIYIPLRDMYVHVLQARCCPEKWFGDGRVPLRRRRPLPADVVVLQRVTEAAAAAGSGATAALPPVSVRLSEATDNDFFVFKEVLPQKAEENAGEVAAPLVKTTSFTAQERPSSWNDPLIDTRFQRMAFLPRWRFSMAHPRLLREARYDTWDAVELAPPLHVDDACCYDDSLGILWSLNRRDGHLWYLRYDNSATTTTRGAALMSVCVTTVDVATAQRCVGMYCQHEGSSSHDAAVGDDEETSRCVCCLLVITTSHALYIRLVYTWCNKFTVEHALSTLKLESVLPKPLQLSSVTCCCPGNAEKPPDVPPSSANDTSFCVGAGRSVFAFIWRNGQWHRVRLASFTATDVTALALHGALGHPSLPVAVVAGMRNGTIQVVTTEGRMRNKAIFNTTPRHYGSDITSMYAVQGLPYGIVSVARDGGAKLWDLRRLGSDKDPVCTLLTSRLGGGQSGVCSTAMAGHLLAVSSVSTGLVCVDAQTGARLFHTTQKLSPATRVALGSLSNVDGNDGFELYTFSPIQLASMLFNDASRASAAMMMAAADHDKDGYLSESDVVSSFIHVESGVGLLQADCNESKLAKLGSSSESDDAVLGSLASLSTQEKSQKDAHLLKALSKIRMRGVEVTNLCSQSNRAKCVAISPDGNLYAVVHRHDNVAHVYMISNGTEQRDNFMVFWDHTIGQECRFSEHPGIVTAAAVSFDGKFVFGGCQDDLVQKFTASKAKIRACARIANAYDLQLIGQLSGHDSLVWKASFNADDSLLFTCCERKIIV